MAKEKTSQQSISIDAIVIDAGTQLRANTIDSVVAEYQSMCESNKSTWPFDSPLVVFSIGDNQFILADGFHRYMGACAAGRASVKCEVHKGSTRDAIQYALSANARHGLRRSNEDKRKAVETALADTEWSKLSSRAVADLCGVSNDFVSKIRKELDTKKSDKMSSDDSAESASAANRSTSRSASHESANSNDLASTDKSCEESTAESDSELQDSTAEDTPKCHSASIVKDSLERDVPEQLRDAYSVANEITAAIRDLDAVKKKIKAITAKVGGSYVSESTVLIALKDCRAELKLGSYWTACPRCNGDGCGKCNSTGFLPLSGKSSLSNQDREMLGV